MSERFVDIIQQELAEERSSALGRCGRRLEDAVAQFRDHETAEGRSSAIRERLLWELAERIEAFVVQREACGLRDARHVLKFYDVPPEALARVGARRPAD